LKINLNKI